MEAASPAGISLHCYIMSSEINHCVSLGSKLHISDCSVCEDPSQLPPHHHFNFESSVVGIFLVHV